MTFHVKALNERLGIQNRIKMMECYKARLEKVRQYDSTKLEFILYYLEHVIEVFVAGDLENSFENTFKIVFDREFDKIHKI